MHFNTLRAFRHGFYACLQRAADALFQAADALLTQPSATSVAELSLAPCFQRRWPSVYAAFADGQVDRTALRALFAHYAPAPHPVNACSWAWMRPTFPGPNPHGRRPHRALRPQPATVCPSGHRRLAVLYAGRLAAHAQQLELYAR